MNIKVPLKPYQREIIEGRIENYRRMLIRNQKEFEKEQKRIQKMLDDGIKFWETNETPVADFKADNDRIKLLDLFQCYSTDIVYRTRNLINISVWKKTQEWVCKYCKRPPGYKYFNYSDSRYDTDVPICDCKGAKKHGVPYAKIKDKK